MFKENQIIKQPKENIWYINFQDGDEGSKSYKAGSLWKVITGPEFSDDTIDVQNLLDRNIAYGCSQRYFEEL